MKRITIAVFSMLFSLAAVNARNINFQVVQNTANKEDVFVSSNVFEQALADFFFDCGHIVSNTPVYIWTDEESDKAELKRALVESVIGSMDFLVRVKVNFDKIHGTNPKACLLDSIESVSWENYSVDTGKLISSGSLKPGKIDDKNNNESGIYNFASDVASKISSGLKVRK